VDLHALDRNIFPELVLNSGGGVQAMFDGASPASPRFLEASIDLPVGAKVTSFSVTTYGCAGVHSSPTPFTFASLNPVGGTYTQHATNTVASNCGASRRTLQTTGNPITTVAAGRRYVIDWGVAGVLYCTGEYPRLTGLELTFIGATVRYTCTAPCVP
jgi:hypothetical protein